MAFENVYLTEEEKNMLDQLKLPYPKEIYWKSEYNYFGRDKTYWTADKSREIYLAYSGEYREEPDEKGFVLVWKEFSSTAMISIILKQRGDYNEEDKLTFNWELIKLNISPNLNVSREEVIKIVKEALFVYWVRGRPDLELDPSRIITFSF